MTWSEHSFKKSLMACLEFCTRQCELFLCLFQVKYTVSVYCTRIYAGVAVLSIILNYAFLFHTVER